MKYEPHPFQKYAISRIVNEANVGLFLSMGLGKTVITLTAIDQLINKYGIVHRVLIIAPKKVAEATWQAEARKWDHLQQLTFATALGTAPQRATAIDSGADITVINRENVVWLVEHWGMAWPFDMVVVDESSSFKSPSAKRFKALKRMLPRIHSVVILTGTPSRISGARFTCWTGASGWGGTSPITASATSITTPGGMSTSPSPAPSMP